MNLPDRLAGAKILRMLAAPALVALLAACGGAEQGDTVVAGIEAVAPAGVTEGAAPEPAPTAEPDTVDAVEPGAAATPADPAPADPAPADPAPAEPDSGDGDGSAEGDIAEEAAGALPAANATDTAEADARPAIQILSASDAIANAESNIAALQTADSVLDIEVLAVGDGSIQTMRDVVVGDRPVLVWFFSPH